MAITLPLFPNYLAVTLSPRALTSYEQDWRGYFALSGTEGFGKQLRGNAGR